MARNTEELLTTGEVARALCYHPLTVWRMIKAGRLPAIQLPSGHYRIRRSALKKLLRPFQSGRNGGKPDAHS